MLQTYDSILSKSDGTFFLVEFSVREVQQSTLEHNLFLFLWHTKY